MVNATVLKYKTKRANKKRQSDRMSPSFHSSQNIGILFTVEDLQKHNTIKQFIEALQKENKNVFALCYLPKGRDNHEFIFDFFIKKDVNYFGQFKNEAANNFMNQDFDFLFLLDQNLQPLTKFILANSNAKCRVGVPISNNESYFEFMIKPRSKNLETITQDFLNYVKKLK